MNKRNILVSLGFIIFVGIIIFLIGINYSYKLKYDDFKFNQEKEIISVLEEKLELLEIFLQGKEKTYRKISSEKVFENFINKKISGEFDRDSYELAEIRMAGLGEDLAFVDENMTILLAANVSNTNKLLNEYFDIRGLNETHFSMYYNYLYNETFMEIVFPVFFNGSKVFFLANVNSSEGRDPYFEDDELSLFLINEEKILIARGEVRGLGDVLVQKIDTKNSNLCFEKKKGEIYYYDGVYENYKGDLSEGGGVQMKTANWCLILERDFCETEIENKKFFYRILYNSALIFLLFFSSFLYFCFLVDCKKYFKKKSKNLKLFGYMIFFIFFIFFYVRNFCFFLEGCFNLKLYDLIPDIIFLFIALFLLGFSFRIDGDCRNYFVFGFLFLGLQKIIEIPFQEYQNIIGSINFFVWLPSLFLSFFGYVLLLKGFSGVRIKNG